ncbi:MAG TPA: hypothetical protein PLO51_02285, partial [Candidatus Micrarchaeota archaeon]|nr:hypothetical protein [Candidatus Micrarchaeota archaeon]
MQKKPTSPWQAGQARAAAVTAAPRKGQKGDVVMVLDKIKRTYYMGDATLDALKDVSFDVRKGEWISIIGPSGS